MKPKLLFFILAWFCSASLYGMEPIDTYKGETITPESLKKQAPEIPVDLQKALVEFSGQHPDLFRELTRFTIEQDYGKQIFSENLQKLEERGIDNLSRSNYIFRLPTAPEYVVQVSGPHHRLFNIIYLNGKWHKDLPTEEDLASYERIKTYQTVSRIAYYLRCREYLEKEDIKDVIIPETFLVSLEPDSSVITDDNAIIVQRFVPDAVSLRAEKSAATQVSRDSLIYFIGLLIHAGFWDIEPNLCISGNSLVLADIEQPNKEKPENFFHKDRREYIHNIIEGLAGLYRLFKEVPELRDEIRKAVRNMNWLHQEEMGAYERKLLDSIKID